MSNRSNYNSNKSNNIKHGLKSVLRWIALALVSATLAAVMVFAFGGLKFENPFDKDINPDNLLKYEDYDKDSMLKETGYGVDVTWKDNGVIVINGKNADPSVEENQVKEYTFSSVTLEAGSYTLSGYEKAQLNTLGLFVNVPGDKTYYDAGSGTTFTVDETTVVTVGFYIGNDKTFINQKLYPTLVSGKTAGEFFVD